MPQTSRTFRVFVSSPFSDLKAERNTLQEKVFPRLRKLAEAHGCRFQAIDLRWGVSEEAALDQQTMKICLGEIERCQKVSPRPNFIILLGNRYGWKPLPYEIPSGEFDRIFPLIPDADKALILQWYRRDGNSVPPVYVIQPRTGEYETYDVWDLVEHKLHTILESAACEANLAEIELVKYRTSATEQEIIQGAFQVVDAKEHIFCYSRELEGMPRDGRVETFIDMLQGIPDSQAAEKLSDLKSSLKGVLGENYHEYPAHWEGNQPSVNHLEKMSEDVYRDLEQIILREIEALEQVEPMKKEVAAHRVFMEERVRHFIGRTEILKQIDGYLFSENHQPLVIWGVSGSGKTALMAKAALNAEKEYPRANFVYRFIGASPDSSNGRSLLESLCLQVTRLYGGDEKTLPLEYNNLVYEFPNRLELATEEKPLVIFLDALDQLSDSHNARSLIWLPAVLPAHVKIIVSSLPGECLQALEPRLPLENRIELKPMSQTEGESLLDMWLLESGRTLQEEQRADILTHFQRDGLPLYLKLAFEEVRRWHSYDGLPKGSDDIPGLGEDIPGVIRDMFWRISQESNHGQVLVEHSLGYLAAAKNGLSEGEMLDVLSIDVDVCKDFLRRSPKSPAVNKLPVVIWSRLYFDLEPYLTEHLADGTSLLGFYHRQLREAVEVDYLGEGNAIARHQSLAHYFSSQPLEVLQEAGVKSSNLRKTSEQVYQQRTGEMWEELFNTLTSFNFLDARCRAASVYDIESDFRLALSGWQGDSAHKKSLDAFEERLRLESHHLGRYPEILFPQLYNYLTWVDKEENGPIHGLCEKVRPSYHNWLRTIQDPRPVPSLWMVAFEGHTHIVSSVVITPDSQLVISGSYDKSIKIWELETGRLLRSLLGHEGRVVFLAVSPDGKTIVSRALDDTLRIWDLESGRLLRTIARKLDLREETMITLHGSLNGLVLMITPDGSRIYFAPGLSLQVIDLNSGRLLGSRDGYHVWGLTPDGQQAIIMPRDLTFEVWDVETWKPVSVLEGEAHIFYMAFTAPDGKRLGIGSNRMKEILMVWDLETGRLLRSVIKPKEIHLLENTKLATPDGQKIIVAKGWHMNVWDLENGQVEDFHGYHDGDIYNIALAPDAHHIVSCSSDKTLKIYDLESRQLLRTLGGYIGDNYGVDKGWGSQTVPDSISRFIRGWESKNKRHLRSMEGHNGYATSIIITKDNQHVISGSLFSGIAMWQLETGWLWRSLERPNLPHLPIRNQHHVTSFYLPPDGCKIIAGYEVDALYTNKKDKHNKYSCYELGMWNLRNGRFLRQMFQYIKEDHDVSINAIAETSNGKWILSGASDNTIQVWDLKKGRMVGVMKDKGDTSTMVLTPDDRMVIGKENAINIWNIENETLIRSLEGHTDLVNSIVLTHNGKQILSGSLDRTLKVWDLQSGLLERNFRYTGGIFVVSPDDRRMIFVDNEHTIMSYDFMPGECTPLFDCDATIQCLTVSPDGHWLACGDIRGRVWIFEWII